MSVISGQLPLNGTNMHMSRKSYAQLRLEFLSKRLRQRSRTHAIHGARSCAETLSLRDVANGPRGGARERACGVEPMTLQLEAPLSLWSSRRCICMSLKSEGT